MVSVNDGLANFPTLTSDRAVEIVLKRIWVFHSVKATMARSTSSMDPMHHRQVLECSDNRSESRLSIERRLRFAPVAAEDTLWTHSTRTQFAGPDVQQQAEDAVHRPPRQFERPQKFKRQSHEESTAPETRKQFGARENSLRGL